MLAQGGQESGLAVLEAVHNGGNFAAWKNALQKITPEQQSPWRQKFSVAGNHSHL
jgi:hypothetical protein